MAINDAGNHEETLAFPLLRQAMVAPSHDGLAMLVEGLTVNGEIVRMAIGINDAQRVGAFLLSASARIAQDNNPVPASEPSPEAQDCVAGPPLQVSGVAVGVTTSDNGLLAISVGSGELAFIMPLESFETLGHTLLTASARPESGRLS